jgi:hypothetical protein
MLSKENLKELLRLQQIVDIAESRIKYLKNRLSTLTEHKCKVDIHFMIHDEDQHAENKARREAMYVEDPSKQSGDTLPKCMTEFIDTISETMAIRMINLIYTEEIKTRDDLIDQMNQIIGRVPGHDTQNPIQELYQQKAII